MINFLISLIFCTYVQSHWKNIYVGYNYGIYIKLGQLRVNITK